jgi:glycosyltransferase involved in cell wall biosynthesis
MRILLDHGLTALGQKSGIGHHAENLALHLQNLIACDVPDFRWIERLPRYVRRWAYFGFANTPGRYDGYDLAHHVNQYVPFASGSARHIMTVLDFSVFRYPETVPFGWRTFNQHALSSGIERADGLIAISEAMKAELLERYRGTPEDRVFVSPCGVRESVCFSGGPEESVSKFGLEPFQYFLFVGDLTRRKNLRFLLEVFQDARKAGGLGRGISLALAGKPAWGYSELANLMREDEGVRCLGYVDERLLGSLYRSCLAFVFPSSYEGFGIPIVEAMHHGAPVIASEIPTSVELDRRHNRQMFMFPLGDRARLREILTHLGRNGAAVRQGLNYGDLTRYTYDNIAREHLEIYARVIGAH